MATTSRQRFPAQREGILYLAEGGQETEVMYRHGFDLPEFAMFTLLDDPAAVSTVKAMYRAYLDVAEEHGFAVLMGGLDYRASPDWAGKLGYSPSALVNVQMRCIDLLRTVAAPSEGRLPDIRVAGVAGPRGDAYEINTEITAESAAEYHAVQLATLATAGVDLVEAMTFNSVPEAVGLARAAADAGLPPAGTSAWGRVVAHGVSRLPMGDSPSPGPQTTEGAAVGPLRCRLFPSFLSSAELSLEEIEWDTSENSRRPMPASPRECPLRTCTPVKRVLIPNANPRGARPFNGFPA